MKLIMKPLEMVRTDDVPKEWKDGRPLLAFGEHQAFEEWASRDWAVVSWDGGWLTMETNDQEDCEGNMSAGNRYIFNPAWLAALPVNLEDCEVAQ